ncbi:MAG: tetratricopeptide repeat protein, partial [Limisphaera sp.]|nr:tetratricopeptide repeat protein [Limisphaera sp.]
MATKKRAIACGLLLCAVAGVWTACTPAGHKALRQGQQSLLSGDLTNALRHLHQAVQWLPTNAVAWNEYAVACHRAGLLSNAAAAYQQALQLNPDLLEAHYNLGCLWMQTAQWEAARSALTTYTLRQPGRPEAWWRLGLSELRLRQPAAAERAFQEMLRLQPGDPRALNGLGLAALQRQRAQDAARYFTAALQSDPAYPAARLNLAVTYHQYLRNASAALEQYRQYLALQPRPENYEAVLETARSLEVALARAVPATNQLATA